MKVGKALVILTALVLPIGIFLFLKIFGENKFEVAPLFQTELPEVASGCSTITTPYLIPGEIVDRYIKTENELSVIVVDSEVSVLSRIFDQFSGDPVKVKRIESSETMAGQSLKECVFLLYGPYDIVLFDKQGFIRGQYYSGDRDEIDRLILELSIILNK